MNLELRSIIRAGELSHERITLRVRSSTDVGDYLLAQSGLGENDEVTIRLQYTYWFTYKPVAAGDLIVLYTKVGTDSEKVLTTGKKAHFFYWGQSSAIWDRPDRAAVLLNAPTWEHKPAKALFARE